MVPGEVLRKIEPLAIWSLNTNNEISRNQPSLQSVCTKVLTERTPNAPTGVRWSNKVQMRGWASPVRVLWSMYQVPSSISMKGVHSAWQFMQKTIRAQAKAVFIATFLEREQSIRWPSAVKASNYTASQLHCIRELRMSSHRYSSLTEVLLSAWREGRHVSDWSQVSPLPQTRAQGYEAQAAFGEATGQASMGWKIAATSQAGQQHINVSSPLAGRLLRSRCQPAGSTLTLGSNRMRVMEPEFAFRMAQDVKPTGTTALSIDTVMAHVKDLHLAIEIPDSRFAHFVQAGEAMLLADFACAHQLVLGEAVTHAWRDLDLSQHAVQVRNHGELKASGSGANVLGDPRLALTWLANELISHGMFLHEGDTVITGTCVVPVVISEGDAIEADFGVLGQITAHFV